MYNDNENSYSDLGNCYFRPHLQALHSGRHNGDIFRTIAFEFSLASHRSLPVGVAVIYLRAGQLNARIFAASADNETKSRSKLTTMRLISFAIVASGQIVTYHPKLINLDVLMIFLLNLVTQFMECCEIAELFDVFKYSNDCNADSCLIAFGRLLEVMRKCRQSVCTCTETVEAVVVVKAAAYVRGAYIYLRGGGKLAYITTTRRARKREIVL